MGPQQLAKHILYHDYHKDIVIEKTGCSSESLAKAWVYVENFYGRVRRAGTKGE